jgi:glyoxylase-like metal-dependent hydrolase (beta-lactamase superfamily II)/8-oxo-dGTP pyrophosphatase MutT (NUDIX family)
MSAAAPQAAPAPRPAATLILLRPGRAGPEVLMLQRTKSAVFLGGAYVFPGGALDQEDSNPVLLERVLEITETKANARLNLSKNAIPYYVAAVRECFEESGIALLCDARGEPLAAQRSESLARYRQSSFIQMLQAEDLYIPGGALAYFGHWITAPGRSRRFDTRFFVALAPEGQQAAHDANETVHHMWVRPQEALERAARGEIELVFATQQTLQDLGRFDECAPAFAYACGLPEIPCNRSCLAQGSAGERVFRRADPQYFEIHWCDPHETGATSYELLPGVPKRLDRFVTRLTAPNPGAMTGPGTNTYLVGQDELAVIDPGPDIESHLDKIISEGKNRIRWILCTHTHLDHSPAAARLKAATGAQVIGRPAPAGQDTTFKPDLVLEHGQRIRIGDANVGLTLRAIHTPGHASNHLCYLLEQTRMLFTGDQVMQGSTVVINPPDGDMRAYLASLESLLGEDIAIIAPGHGYLIGEPHRELRRLIAHRLAREAKVKSVLARRAPASLEEMLPFVYDDVPERMHRWAARSLTAHLDKLLTEGAVSRGGAGYTLVQSPKGGGA